MHWVMILKYMALWFITWSEECRFDQRMRFPMWFYIFRIVIAIYTSDITPHGATCGNADSVSHTATRFYTYVEVPDITI